MPRLPSYDPRTEEDLISEDRALSPPERARRIRELSRVAWRQLSTMPAARRERALEQTARSDEHVRWWIDWVASCRR